MTNKHLVEVVKILQEQQESDQMVINALLERETKILSLLDDMTDLLTLFQKKL